MAYLPELKVEIVDLINKGNNLTIADSNVDIAEPDTGSDDVKVKITGAEDYYGKQVVTYRRRDPNRFFKNIPVFSAVDSLGKTVTGIQVLAMINTYWLDLIDYSDIEEADLQKEYTLGELLSMPASFRFKGTSKAWQGTFTLAVIQRLINLNYIVEKGDVTLANPSTMTMKTYHADFTPYGKLLNAAGDSGVVSDDLVTLLSRGLNNIDLTGATILANARTSKVTDYKVNGKYDYVLILKPVNGNVDDIVYIHYDYISDDAVALSTEDGFSLSDEDGNVLVM